MQSEFEPFDMKRTAAKCGVDLGGNPLPETAAVLAPDFRYHMHMSVNGLRAAGEAYWKRWMRGTNYQLEHMPPSYREDVERIAAEMIVAYRRGSGSVSLLDELQRERDALIAENNALIDDIDTLRAEVARLQSTASVDPVLAPAADPASYKRGDLLQLRPGTKSLGGTEPDTGHWWSCIGKSTTVATGAIVQIATDVSLVRVSYWIRSEDVIDAKTY